MSVFTLNSSNSVLHSNSSICRSNQKKECIDLIKNCLSVLPPKQDVERWRQLWTAIFSCVSTAIYLGIIENEEKTDTRGIIDPGLLVETMVVSNACDYLSNLQKAIFTQNLSGLIVINLVYELIRVVTRQIQNRDPYHNKDSKQEKIDETTKTVEIRTSFEVIMNDFVKQVVPENGKNNCTKSNCERNMNFLKSGCDENKLGTVLLAAENEKRLPSHCNFIDDSSYASLEIVNGYKQLCKQADVWAYFCNSQRQIEHFPHLFIDVYDMVMGHNVPLPLFSEAAVLPSQSDDFTKETKQFTVERFLKNTRDNHSSEALLKCYSESLFSSTEAHLQRVELPTQSQAPDCCFLYDGCSSEIKSAEECFSQQNFGFAEKKHFKILQKKKQAALVTQNQQAYSNKQDKIRKSDNKIQKQPQLSSKASFTKENLNFTKTGSLHFFTKSTGGDKTAPTYEKKIENSTIGDSLIKSAAAYSVASDRRCLKRGRPSINKKNSTILLNNICNNSSLNLSQKNVNMAKTTSTAAAAEFKKEKKLKNNQNNKKFKRVDAQNCLTKMEKGETELFLPYFNNQSTSQGNEEKNLNKQKDNNDNELHLNVAVDGRSDVLSLMLSSSSAPPNKKLRQKTKRKQLEFAKLKSTAKCKFRIQDLSWLVEWKDNDRAGQYKIFPVQYRDFNETSNKRGRLNAKMRAKRQAMKYLKELGQVCEDSLVH